MRKTFQAGVKVWIADAAWRGAFGEGRARLLEGVAAHGSLRKAAAAMGMSYRKAWGDIRAAEARLGRPLIIRLRGGAGGGASCLTPFGTALLKAYGRYKSAVMKGAAAAFRRHCSEVCGTGAATGTLHKNGQI